MANHTYPGASGYGSDYKTELQTMFNSYKSIIAEKNVPIVMGEFSASDFNNTESRIKMCIRDSNNIAISGLVPSDVIDRITSYTPVYDSDEIVSSKNIQDSTYYPTQYSIELDCRKAGLSRKDSVLFLNRLTEMCIRDRCKYNVHW